ncbi:hypothetical protein CBFG_04786 [Clostridiales bacterium 1_7_47FAA]|nr:hypothetical protein CBFG_04786 [Clostridiales bacterium 1_7_47FAA]
MGFSIFLHHSPAVHMNAERSVVQRQEIMVISCLCTTLPY